MTGSGSPCGACKFLRRKCVKGCVFAPYFCHEQGASHFAAIHKVFGASNVAKLLAHLPVSDRCEAAVTISYEAQARLQDPIYGCVSHIFALQQQVVDLQEQLISLKKLAANNQSNNLNDSMASANPNDRSNNGTPCYPSSLQDVHNWFHYSSQNPTAAAVCGGAMAAAAAEFYPAASSNACSNGGNLHPAAIYYSNINENPIYMGSNNIGNNYSYADASSSSMDDLQSAALRFLHH
ncbi:PREDICTED: LOB domain-containing protein 29-like [Ipomoea nil]|uniref:LOB domain-containing protein 29-like n=1 Tax=Ipomoea nil TaxID=35883 RepID=UPI0009011D66|nr:PREDICTED: LOB domain-containing protein 29-like [Ipomoea nil]